MGTRGIEIVNMDVDKVIGLLNKAFADEWLAYYQYWLGSRVVAGPMKEAVITELTEHAQDELRHAEMVANRIIQLGGEPLMTPRMWFDETNCGYDAPSDTFVERILEQNIKGEQCAITVYNDIIQEVGMKDHVTYNLALQILEDEVEHEEDLQSLLEDIAVMLKK
jgi:bacterioferritin